MPGKGHPTAGRRRDENGGMDEHAAALHEALARRLGPFVEACVTGYLERSGSPVTVDERRAARQAGRDAEADVLPRLAALLGADVDDQRATPLSLVREAVAFATGALDRCQARPAARDRFLLERFPDDRYGLVPASLDALGEDVTEAGIAWGAAKALAHRRRHGT